MRKLIAVLIAITVLFSAGAFADDLSALTDEELLALYQDVLDEMNRREIPDEPETDSELTDIEERVILFFAAWNRNDPDAMLALCDSGWKETVEDPRTALPGILADCTPLDVTIVSVDEIAGDSPDSLICNLVTVTTHLDENNGQSPAEKYDIRLLVRKEEDGYWYIDPTGIDTREAVEEAFPAEADPEKNTETAAADVVLYYQPAGGEYYHLDQNCKRVNPEFLPLQGNFLYSELNDEPYRTLKRCEICGAPYRAENRSDSMSFRDAVDAAGEYAAIGGDMDYLVVAAKKDNWYYRTVTILDDRAKELYMNAMAAEDSWAAFDAFAAYAWSLPVCYTEEITGELSAFLSLATNLDYLADGTYQPQVVPHITAEEAAAADSVPPLEEYSQKAWPLTDENYFDLQYNLDARYGQVYMVEGVVHQVLSRNPLKVIINTGEDGKSQPVVVECPEQRSFNLETGNTCRIYADVSSACYILPVLTARYLFAVQTEDPADEPAP